MTVDFDFKIHVPQHQHFVLSRPRLIERLRGATSRRLITITAPAGYGKTTLLVDFAHGHELPVAWYTLDQYDADPWSFLAYLTAAINHVFPEGTPATSALLASKDQTSYRAAGAALLREIYALSRPFTLIIDDWHLVDHVPEIANLLDNLLLRCQNCQVILASRLYPSLPDMMQFVARRQMVGLDEALLRFTVPEAAAVLTLELGHDVPLDQAAALAERVNGWITGILLAAQTDAPTVSSALGAGAERQIYSFLAEQVLDQQTPELRRFMLESALLDELSAPRCDSILRRRDSAAMIAAILWRRNFIQELSPGTFRYHPLYREFLQESFRSSDPDGFRATARQVAEAYRAERLWSQAFDVCLLADDEAGARGVLRQGGEETYAAGRLETLDRWFAALPLDQLEAPLVALKARVALNRGQLHEAEALASLAQQRMRPGEEVAVWLLRAQIERVAGRYNEAIELGSRALAAAADDAQRAFALNVLASCEQRAGRPRRSIALLNEALAIEQQRGDVYAVALIEQDLGISYEEAGQLRRAADCFSRAEAYWSIAGNVGRRAITLNSRGIIEHLTGQYRAAFATLNQALQFAQEAGTASYQAMVLASLGDLHSDLGLLDQAAALYEEARQARGSAYLVAYLAVAAIRLLIRQRCFEVAADALAHLDPEIAAQHPTTVACLHTCLAVARNARPAAIAHAQSALSAAGAAPGREHALAYLYVAYAYSLEPAEPGAAVGALDQAVQTANNLGTEAFLVAEAAFMPGLLRYAQTAGWARATAWRHYQQGAQLLGQMLSAHDERPLLTVRTLGNEQISVNGQEVELGWLRAREVLFYLLANPAGASTDSLREAIWPELLPEQSRSALKTAVYQLRKALPADLIVLHGRQSYRLDRKAARIDFDVDRFLELADATDPGLIEEALDLYQGPFLQSSDNSWCTSLRTLLEQRYLAALQRAAEMWERRGAVGEALACYRRLLATDPLNEAAHGGVMRCQIALNNRAAAIDQYHALRRLLLAELGLDLSPSSETERLYQRLLSE